MLSGKKSTNLARDVIVRTKKITITCADRVSAIPYSLYDDAYFKWHMSIWDHNRACFSTKSKARKHIPIDTMLRSAFFRKTRSVTVPLFEFYPRDTPIRINRFSIWQCHLYLILVLSAFDHKMLSKWISEVRAFSYFSYCESELQSHKKSISFIAQKMALSSLFRYMPLWYETFIWYNRYQML